MLSILFVNKPWSKAKINQVKRALLKAVLCGRLELILEANKNVVELDVVVGEPSCVDTLKHSEHSYSELKDAFVSHLATLLLEVVFKVWPVPWHNHVWHQNRLFLLEQIVWILDDHSILNNFWCGALGVVVDFPTLFVGLFHGIDLLAEQFVVKRDFNDEWPCLVLQVYNLVNLTEWPIVDMSTDEVSLL